MATLTENAPPAAGLPKIAGRTEGGEQPAQVVPPPAFLFKYHPRRWQVLLGEVVPMLGRTSLRNGCNGVEVRRDGSFDLTNAKADSRSQGWTDIPWDVDGPGTAYIQEIQGGWYTQFEKLYPGATSPDTDTEGYVAWLRSLVDRKIIPEPPLSVLDKLRTTYAKRRNTIRTKQPDVAEDMVKRIKVVDAYVKKLKTRARRGKPIKASAAKPPATAG
jgi:hypothetical protein